METDSKGVGYSPEEALADVNQMRITMLEESIATPAVKVGAFLLGMTFPISNLAFLIPGSYWRWVLIALPLAASILFMAYVIHRVEKTGLMSWGFEYFRLLLAPNVFFGVGVLIGFLVLPVTDSLGLSPWTPFFASLVTWAGFAVYPFWTNRLILRQIRTLEAGQMGVGA